MKKLKLLFTSVGRRVELVEEFRLSAKRIGLELEIWGGDMSKDAPALFFCDKTVQLYKIKDSNYVPQLLEICEKEKIDAIIPTIDTDLLLLAQNKEKFKAVGTKVIVSDESKVELCRDKRLTAKYFQSLGLYSPISVDDISFYNEGFPAFIKPKDGSSSLFAYKVNSQKELEMYAKQVPDYIVQPFISGKEFTIDIFCSLDGDPIYITPRERNLVRAGEVMKTRINNDQKMIDEMLSLVADYKPCGAITVQLIQQEGTNKNYYIEINSRFGGGAPLSMRAGANSSEALLRILCGETMEFKRNSAEEGATYCRFDHSIRVDK